MVELIRYLFIPHHTNNFRARILHFEFLVIFLGFFVYFNFFFKYLGQVDPNILGFATDIRIEKLVELTNQKRQENGLPTLKLNPVLSQAANFKAQDMFADNYWAHTAPDGTTPWDFINGAGYVYTVAGENLAKNFSNSEGVVEAWMNSPSHKENVLRNQYEDVGFAVANGVLNGEETTLVVQMFGKPVKPLFAQNIPENIETNNSLEFPVAPALAQEDQEEVEHINDEQEKTASETAIVTNKAQPPKAVEITNLAGSVVKKPLIDFSKLTKNFSLGVSLIILMVLIFDGYYVWRHQIVRVGGKHIAHIVFIFALTSLIWMTTFGRILEVGAYISK